MVRPQHAMAYKGFVWAMVPEEMVSLEYAVTQEGSCQGPEEMARMEYTAAHK